MKKLVVAAMLAAGLSAAAAVPYKLGVAGYMFARGGMPWTLEVLQEINCRYLCHKDFMLPYDASDAQIAAFKKMLAKAGLECLATGPLYATDEASVRKQFDFAKRYGMKVVVGVPYDLEADGKTRVESDRMLDIIDRLVKEYNICYAIHNHGPDIPKLFPTAASAMKRIGNRDKRIGVCIDIGHDQRSFSDPAAFIRKHGERIYDVHIKNIKIQEDRSGVAVPGPRGDLDIPGILKALAEVNYTGVCHIEFEKGYSATVAGLVDHAMGLAESFGYYRGCMDAIKVKPALERPPRTPTL
jgi:sugar phosphate isomerase/epimerase